MTDAILELDHLRFAWPRSSELCLEIEELRVVAGETVFLYGPSGCGKSTLLSLMAGVLLPQDGSILLGGKNWADMRASRRDRYRVEKVGYIFQQFNLLPYLSVLDNVMAPCRFSFSRRSSAVKQSGSVRRDAELWLDGMGLETRHWSTPACNLSVGQQQRVAAARALIGNPALVIADEPTSALDENRRNDFLDLLLSACRAANSALVFVSHDQRIAQRFERHILLPAINHAAEPEEVSR
jgi:putative ABC transport system ATP-binding protein